MTLIARPPRPDACAPAASPVRPEAGVPVHDARALTTGAREARILLDGKVYTLRITRQGKLILTK